MTSPTPEESLQSLKERVAEVLGTSYRDDVALKAVEVRTLRQEIGDFYANNEVLVQQIKDHTDSFTLQFEGLGESVREYADNQLNTYKSEVTNILGTKSDKGHKHTLSEITDLIVTPDATANTVPRRNADGQLVLPLLPAEDEHAASKKFVVDTATEAAVHEPGSLTTELYADSSVTTVKIEDSAVTLDKIAETAKSSTVEEGKLLVGDSSNAIKVGTPTEGEHPAPKAYVDSAITTHKHTSDDITDATAVLVNRALVRREDNNTNIRVSETPASTYHATSKMYVDGKVDDAKSTLTTAIAGKSDVGHTHTSAQISDATLDSVPNTLVKRGGTGGFYVIEPNNPSMPTTKKYVDNAVAAATDGGYNTRDASDAASVYPVGVSVTLNNVTSKGWSAAIGAASLPSLGSFVVVTTIKQGIYDNSTWQYLSSFTDATLPVLVRKWLGGSWSTLRRLTDDGHTHTSDNVTDKLAGVWTTSTTDNRLIATSGGGFIQTSKTPVSGTDVTNKIYVDSGLSNTYTEMYKRPAIFSGPGVPPSNIAGAVVGDLYFNETTKELLKITKV